MIAAVVTNLLDLMEASLLAAVALVVFRVISANEARRSVNLNVVLTIAMSISLGTAVAVSGLAAKMATVLGDLGDPFGETGRIVAVLVATMILTELLGAPNTRATSSRSITGAWVQAKTSIRSPRRTAYPASGSI